VLALDMLKAVVAVLLPLVLAAMAGGVATAVDGEGAAVPAEKLLVRSAACGLSVVAGHVWPALLGFRGGKGVGPFLGVWLAMGAVAWPTYWFAPFTLCAPLVGAVFFLPLKRGVFLAALCALPTQACAFWWLSGSAAAALPAFVSVFIVMFAHSENFRRKRK
jgi:glycerol-3-phosphate acyltransferase PlsY